MSFFVGATIPSSWYRGTNARPGKTSRAAASGEVSAAILLRDINQLSTEDAAAVLGLGVPALKARL
jgi:hypothetical protein